METKRKQNVKMDTISSKQKLILAICFLLIIIVLLWISKQIFNKDEFDYRKITHDDFIYSGLINTDRQIYWSLNEIISNILNSYKNIGKEEGIKPEDYYDVLSEDYKEYLGKRKYKKLINEFLQKFVVKNSYTTTIKTSRIIENVYYLNNNRYICELSTASEENKAYIGITLNTSNKTYNIFYIE